MGQPRTTWTKNIHDDLSLLDLGVYEAIEIWRKNRLLWRLMSSHSATHS